ncbi:MAG: hypothetical protein AAFX04_03915 [Pseudomonadota bacterium]
MARNTEANRSEIIVRLFRCWSAARSMGCNPLPEMHNAIAFFKPAPELGSACESLFCLTEALLGRILEPGYSCSPTLSRDERALLLLLRLTPSAGHIHTSRAIPHGLPTALQCAAWSVLRALGDVLSPDPENAELYVSAGTCPFDTALPAQPEVCTSRLARETGKVIPITRPSGMTADQARNG